MAQFQNPSNNSLLTLTMNANNSIVLGPTAGISLGGSDIDNIMIGNGGTGGDTNTIRIGTDGSGAGQQNKLFLAGAYGITPSGSPQMAIIDASGQLGSQAITSSGLIWQQSSAGSISAAKGNGYILIGGVGACTITLPNGSASTIGDEVAIINGTGRAWTINVGDSAGGDRINFSRAKLGNTMKSVAGGFGDRGHVRLLYCGDVGSGVLAWTVIECTVSIGTDGTILT